MFYTYHAGAAMTLSVLTTGSLSVKVTGRREKKSEKKSLVGNLSRGDPK